MAWLKIDETLSDHPKVIKVAEALKLDKDMVVGKLVRLWIWALNNREDGVFTRQDVGTIAEVMRYKGKADKLIQALVESGLLNEKGGSWIIHDWTDYAGGYVEKRAATNERKQKERQRKRDERVTLLLNKEENPSDDGVIFQGRARDISVTPSPQQRDESVTVTPLEKEIEKEIDIEYDNGGETRAHEGVCACTREDPEDHFREATKKVPLRDGQFSALIQTYEQNIRIPTPIEAESISQWLNDLPANVIDYAIKQAALSGIRSWRGVETILLRWQSVGVNTLAGAEAAQREWQGRRSAVQQQPYKAAPQSAVGRALSNLDALMARTLEEEHGRNHES
jgi:DnaD/phage-associated family protein